MKSQNILHLFTLLFIFSACSDSHINENKITPPKNQDGGSYFEVTLYDENEDIGVTRAATDAKINDITFYLTTVHYTGYRRTDFCLAIKDIVKGYGLSQQNNLIKVKAHTSLETGKYLVVAVANTSNINWTKNIGDTIYYHDEVLLKKEDMYNITNGIFFMTSSGKPIIYPNTNIPVKDVFNSYSLFMMSLRFSYLIDYYVPEYEEVYDYPQSLLELNYNTVQSPAKTKIYLDRFVAAIQIKENNTIPLNNLFLEKDKNLNFKFDGFETLNSPLRNCIFEFPKYNYRKHGETVNGYYPKTLYYHYDLYKEGADLDVLNWYNQLDSYATIENNKVVGYKDSNTYSLFTPKIKYVPENNTSTKPSSLLANRQGYVTGVIFRVKEASGKSFYVTKSGNKKVFVSYDPSNPSEVEDIPAHAVKYEEGVMYYTYYIPDLFWLLTHEETGWKKYYTVMRNTKYTLNINSLSFPGGVYPGGDLPNPEDPDEDIVEDKYSNLDITVEVNPWIEGDIDVDI